MGSAESRDRPRGSSVVKIVRAGGKVEIYFRPVTAQEVMLRYPRHLVTSPEVFRSDVEKALIPPETMLLPGKKFFLVPRHTVERIFLHRQVLSKLSGRSSTSPHLPVTSPGMPVSPRRGKRRRGGKGRAGKSPSRSSARRADGGQSGWRRSAISVKEVATTCGADATHVEGSSKKTVLGERSASIIWGGSERGENPARVKELDELVLTGGEDEKVTKFKDDLSELSAETEVVKLFSGEAETEPLLRKERGRGVTLGQHLRSSMSSMSEAPNHASIMATIESEIERPFAIAEKESQEQPPGVNDGNSEEKLVLSRRSGHPSRPDSELHQILSDGDPNLDFSNPSERIQSDRNSELGFLELIGKERVRETLSDHFSKRTTIGSEARRMAQPKTIVQAAAPACSASSFMSSSYWSQAAAPRKPPPPRCSSPSRKRSTLRQHLDTLGFHAMKSENPSIIAQLRQHKRADRLCSLALPTFQRTVPSSPPLPQTPSPDRCRSTKIELQGIENPPLLNVSTTSSPQLTSQNSLPTIQAQEYLQSRSFSAISHSLPIRSGSFQPLARSVYRPPRTSLRRIRYFNYGRTPRKPLSPILEASPECLQASFSGQVPVSVI